MTGVAINGFGGRLVARAMLEKSDSGLEPAAINDLADWYDSELGFSNRMADTAAAIARLI